MILIIKHITIEGPGLLGDYFIQKGYDLKTVELENGDGLPQDLKDVEAVVCLGGPMNVYEEEKYPYFKEEDTFIKKVIKKEIPFLGICLGAQLLSKASGGKIEKAPEKEIGVYKIKLTDSGNLDDAVNLYSRPCSLAGGSKRFLP